MIKEFGTNITKVLPEAREFALQQSRKDDTRDWFVVSVELPMVSGMGNIWVVTGDDMESFTREAEGNGYKITKQFTFAAHDVRVVMANEDWHNIHEVLAWVRELGPAHLKESADSGYEAFIAGTPLDRRADLLDGVR